MIDRRDRRIEQVTPAGLFEPLCRGRRPHLKRAQTDSADTLSAPSVTAHKWAV